MGESLPQTLREIKREQRNTERIRKLRLKSILKKGMGFVPFTLLSPEGEKHALEICLRMRCAMEVLSDHVMTCPVHSTVHRCGDNCWTVGRCLTNSTGNSSCVFSLRSVVSEDRIEDDAFLNAPHQKEGDGTWTGGTFSVPGMPAPPREDLRWFAKERFFRRTVVQTISKLCDEHRRSRYNALMRSASGRSDSSPFLKGISRRDVGLRMLLERDLYEFCMGLLGAADTKKTRRFLLDNAHTFVFVALERLLRGLHESGTPVLRPPDYAKRLYPLPRKKLFETCFGTPLPNHSKCLKHVQVICEGKVFRSAIRERFRVCRQQGSGCRSETFQRGRE